MDWMQLVAGIGIGTFGAKVLDIMWLQQRVQEDQHRTWLREKRLEAFAEVTRAMMSFGLHEGPPKSPFELYGTISKALLLLDDDVVVKRIDQFVVDLDRLNDLVDSPAPRDDVLGNTMYQKLVGEGREITRLLRTLLLHGRTGTS